MQIFNTTTKKLAYEIPSLKRGESDITYDLQSFKQLKKLTFSLKVPEFQWSEPVEFLTGDMDDPVKVPLVAANGLKLELLLDVKFVHFSKLGVPVTDPLLSGKNVEHSMCQYFRAIGSLTKLVYN